MSSNNDNRSLVLGGKEASLDLYAIFATCFW